MKIDTISLHSYQISLHSGGLRFGVLVQIKDQIGNSAWGEVAPLPKWSREALSDSIKQLEAKKVKILEINWSKDNWIQELKALNLLPSLSFGLESALLALLDPLPAHKVITSALLMGTPEQILDQAKQRKKEGFFSAKLKVSNLSFQDAFDIIQVLKNQFLLRVDVNKAWKTEESIQFFSQFQKDTFDYVEEPFQNSAELASFQHPLAIDESFPTLSLKQMESFPTLKALIYKPTIQGGLIDCLPLKKWADEKGVAIVLSSSFESDFGLAHVASLSHRLNLNAPVGIGTYHFLNNFLCANPLHFSKAELHIPEHLFPKPNILQQKQETGYAEATKKY